MDGNVGFRANMAVDDNVVLQTADQALMNLRNVEEVPKYRCGDCGHINELKLQDAIRCRMCGFRVLYKVRTNRMVQFEAR
mmetsp:Transcript_12601/g.25698  ORF Transcript_12601/g.25698 Transcript_12601/m.25698 type:complete len:80 (+) Transcript_12601:36-275(+)